MDEATLGIQDSSSSQVEPPPWESPQWQEAVSQNLGLAPFFDNLESFVELPEGVEKLRELFLDLAIRGKLVNQNLSEGDGSSLLTEIAEERVEYLKSRSLKKSKSLKPPSPDAFQVPANWGLTHLDDLAYQVHYGYTASADQNLRDVRMLRITDIQNNMVNWETVPGCEIDEDKVAQYELADNDLLIARTGGTIGKTYLINDVSVRSVFASYLIRVIPSQLLCAEYLKRYLECPFYWRQLRAKSAGTGQPNVNATSLKSLIVPLPPLAEQRRIVSKVEGLMSLCETLESQRRARMRVRERASRSVLASLTSAPVHTADNNNEPQGDSPGSEPSRRATTGAIAHRLMNGTETLASAWQRLSDHFEVLLDQPSGPKHLRQSILQLAVQGKLVPQDPSDEPAGELIEKIQQEKADLIAAKKLKKSSSHTKRDRGTQDWQLPVGWAWTIVDDLTSVGTGTTPTKGNHEYYQGGTVPWITSASTNNEFIEEPAKYVTELAVKERNMRLYPKGSLVVALYGQGKTRGQVGQLMFDSTSNQANAVLEFFGTGWECRDYFRLVFLKKYHELRELAAGGAQPNLSGGLIRLTTIPVPPLAEQRRIVSKVSVLLSQLDELSTKMRARESTTDALLTALIHQILKAKS